MAFRPVVAIALALIAGILCGRALDPWAFPLEIFMGTAMSCCILACLALSSRRRFWIYILAAVFWSGWGLEQAQWNRLQADFAEGLALLTGRVDSFPARLRPGLGGARVRFTLRAQGMHGSGESWRRTDQDILVSAPAGPLEVRYGDRLLLRGEARRPGPAHNPGGFDPEAYLESQDVAARFSVRDARDCRLLARGQGWAWLERIGRLKAFLQGLIRAQIPAPEGGIVNALLLGDQDEIPYDVRDGFAKSGTAHLLAISGGNVALIVFLFIAVLKLARVPRKIAAAAGIVLLAGYCLLTGSPASVARSCLMLGVVLLGSLLGREPELITSLSWAAIFLLAFQPLQLFDVGFQLSFLTVLALGLALPEEDAEPWPGRNRLQGFPLRLWQSARVSAAAWAGTLPLAVHVFCLVSPVTVLANLVIVPYVSLVMACGLAFLILGGIHARLREALGLATWFLTKLLERLCSGFAALPGAFIRVRPPSWPEVAALYLLFLAWALRKELNLGRFRLAILALATLNLLAWTGLRRARHPELRVTFLDVGHGDAAVLEFPGGGTLLVDAGSGGDWDQGRLAVAPFLWSRGITRLDAVLITHPHFDHYGGLAYLLREFPVGTVFDDGDRCAPLYEENFRRGPGALPRREKLQEGDRLEGVEGLRLDVLGPLREILEDPRLGPNDRSLILRVAYGSMSLLLAGDAERAALRSLIRYRGLLRCTLLKVPHHGSDNKEEGEEFLRWARPGTAVISEARQNRFHLPSHRTLAALAANGARTYQTGSGGAVEFITDGRTCRVRSFPDP